MVVIDPCTYLICVLKRMGRRFVEERRDTEGVLVEQLVERLSRTRDAEQLLQRLYRVNGLDQFALALMWLTTHTRLDSNGRQEELLEYEIQMLCSILLGEPRDRAEQQAGVTYDFGDLDEALDRFSRCIADVKRRLTRGGKLLRLDEDVVHRIKQESLLLQSAARFAEDNDVVRFCESLDHFLEYVMEHRLLGDVRVLNVIDNANLTLQTVMGIRVAEDRHALHQTSALLIYPETIFNQLPS